MNEAAIVRTSYKFKSRAHAVFSGRESSTISTLTHAGKISHQMALEKSAEEYAKYQEAQRQIQREESLRELERDIRQLKPVHAGKKAED